MDQPFVISPEESRRPTCGARRVVRLEDFTDEELAKIARAEVPLGHVSLDDELKDWQPSKADSDV